MYKAQNKFQKLKENEYEEENKLIVEESFSSNNKVRRKAQTCNKTETEEEVKITPVNFCRTKTEAATCRTLNNNKNSNDDNQRKLCDIFKALTLSKEMKSNKMKIIIDSGASTNMFPYKEIFLSLMKPEKEISVIIGDGTTIKIDGIGETQFGANCYYIKALPIGIVSTSVFDILGHEIKIRNRNCIITKENIIIWHAVLNEQDKLYYLTPEYLEKIKLSDMNMLLLERKEIEERLLLKELSLDKSMKKIHILLGHLSENRIKIAWESKSMIFPPWVTEDIIRRGKVGICEFCLAGHARKASRKPTTNHNHGILEKVGVDYKGPFSIRSGKYNGFILFSCYTSDLVYAFMVNAKDQLLQAIKTFDIKFVRKTNRKMKIVQSDQDRVITGNDVQTYLLDNNIELQLSTPYFHSENGQIESDMKRVTNKSRTLMVGVPPSMWAYAVKHACYLLNRYPSKSQNQQSPYEQVFQIVPSFEKEIPFYCPGYYFINDEEQPRADLSVPKVRRCYYLGHDEQAQNSLLIRDALNGAIKVRNQATFEIEKMVREIFYEKLIQVDDSLQEGDHENTSETSEAANQSTNDESPISSRLRSRMNVLQHLNESDDEEDKVPIHNARVPTSLLEAMKNLNPNNSEDEDIFKEDEDTESANFLSPVDIWNNKVLTMKNFSLPKEPKTIEEALNPANEHNMEWKKAIIEQAQVLQDYEVFKIAEDQQGRTMKTKWVFKVALKNDLTFKFKARLVVCGYSQVQGIDFYETFSPTPSLMVIFIIFHLWGNKNLKAVIYDVTAAFLEGRNDTKQFCYLPKELSPNGKEKIRVEIVGSLYGEKQAPKIWNDLLNTILIELGFKRSNVAPCLYTKYDKDKFIFMVIHVDDGLVTSNCENIIKLFFNELAKHLKKITIYDPCMRYLGMDLEKKVNHIYLNQNTYICDLNLFNDENKSINVVEESIPMDSKLDLKNSNKNQPNENNSSLLPATGAFRFVVDRTRPDALNAVGEVSSNSTPFPSDAHIETAKQIERYLKSTPNMMLRLGGEGEIKLFAFSDSSHVGVGKCRSRLGGAFYLGLDSGAFHSMSKRSSTVSLSAFEDEIKAIVMVTCVIIHVRDILEDLQLKQLSPTVIYTDSDSSIKFCNNFKISDHSKHILTRINFIRECINHRIIELKFINSEFNVADTLTKALDAKTFNQHSKKLLNGFGGKISNIYEKEIL